MSRNFLLIMALMAVLSAFFVDGTALAQNYVLDEVLIISNGRLVKLGAAAAIRDYVEIKRGAESISAHLGCRIPVGASITAKTGANLKLESRERLLWLNYGATVHQESDEIRVTGEVYGKGRRFRLCGNRLKLIETRTEFYVNVDEDSGTELLYVFKGNVEAATTSDMASQTVSKKKAVRVSENNILESVELEDVLYKPDIKRIKKWRDDIHWLDLPWYKRLIRLPKRYPKITITTLALVGGKIVYEIGQSKSELDVKVCYDCP